MGHNYKDFSDSLEWFYSYPSLRLASCQAAFPFRGKIDKEDTVSPSGDNIDFCKEY